MQRCSKSNQSHSKREIAIISWERDVSRSNEGRRDVRVKNLFFLLLLSLLLMMEIINQSHSRNHRTNSCIFIGGITDNTRGMRVSREIPFQCSPFFDKSNSRCLIISVEVEWPKSAPRVRVRLEKILNNRDGQKKIPCFPQ